jgi:SPP1 family predicted phage head-tail adaptor
MKLKDKKIDIMQVTHGKDPEGFPIEQVTPLAAGVWAYFRQLSGKEIYASAAVQATEEVLFIIGYRADVTTAHIIRFRGVDYDITRIDTFEGYKGDLGVYAKKRG